MKESKIKKQAKTTKSDKKAINKTFEYFLTQDREAEKNRPKITNKERLIFLFKTLIESGWRNGEGVLIVPFDKIMVKPYFYPDDMESVYLGLPYLFKHVQTDKDFYRKHNMLNYNPTFAFNTKREYSNLDDLIFKDYTDDFLKEYLEDRLGEKYSSKNKSGNKTIHKIEILKNEQGRIKVYINSKYDSDPLDFARGKNWQLMYKIANKEDVAYDNKSKEFYDYFNHNKNNPLYKKHGFEVTKILKEEDGYIVPSIKIELTTENKITRQLKSA